MGGAEELEIHLEGKKLKQRDSFVYLGGVASRGGKSDSKIRRRITAGANTWRKVKGVMKYRHMSHKNKRKGLSLCGITAYMYDLKTVAITKK